MRDLDSKPVLDGVLAGKALGPLLAEWDKWRSEGGRLSRELTAARARDRQAAEADRSSAAKAARVGDADPGPVEAKKLEALIAELEHKVGVAVEVRQNVERDVQRQLREHGEDWAADALERARERGRELSAAVNTVGAIAADVARLDTAARWLASEGNAKLGGQLQVMVDGRPVYLAELLEVLSSFRARATVASIDAELEPVGGRQA